MNHLKELLSDVDGGVAEIAKACNVSARAVYKWIKLGRLPRTDYTGETAYAQIISGLPGCESTKDDLLKINLDQINSNAA